MAGNAPLTDRELLIISGASPFLLASVTIEALLVKGRLATTSTSFGTVLTFTVPVGANLTMRELSFAHDKPNFTRFRVTLAGVVRVTDDFYLGPSVALFENIPFAAGDVVLIEARSTDGTLVTIDGQITGTQRS